MRSVFNENERLELYKKALVSLREEKESSSSSQGICCHLMDHMGRVEGAWPTDVMKQFPELCKRKTQRGDLHMFWWPMRQFTPRIECLESIIKELETKIRTNGTEN